jgi:hypothetical protein
VEAEQASAYASTTYYHQEASLSQPYGEFLRNDWLKSTIGLLREYFYER